MSSDQPAVTMPIKTLKKIFVASGPLVLFLLVTATMVLQHTGAICDAEWSTCFDDEVCNECYYGWSESDEAFDAHTECLDDYPDIDYGADIDWCFVYAASPCCKAAVSSNDCLGNSAFVEYHVCSLNYSTTSQEKGECTALTCNDGMGAVLADDDADTADDNAGTADDDAGEADADAGAADDDAGAADDDADIADDDAGAADDDADIAAGNGGTSRTGSSSPSVVRTAVRGFAFFIAAPCLAASL